VAPKIIGGTRAPTPVDDLGFVEMTQAVNLIDSQWSQVRAPAPAPARRPGQGGRDDPVGALRWGHAAAGRLAGWPLHTTADLL